MVNMKFLVYVLNSLKDNKHYVGQTSNLDRRLEEHNQGRVRWTKSHRPWKVIYVEEYSSRTEAIRREHFLKSPQGWIEYINIRRDGRGFPEGITS
jgi:putative endonuclease